MKTAYNIILTALCVIFLSWFLPWLYSLLFPVASTDPFVAFSPITSSFIVSQPSGGAINAVDSYGNICGTELSKEDRDSLLPQIYYTQLLAKGRLPDSVNGLQISVPMLKQAQWVFSSSPRDVNKKSADVYLMMESMPPRIDLEDPESVFRLDNKVEFVDILTNKVIEPRSQWFTDVFSERGFKYPAKALNANITARKNYDEGYLMIDDKGDIFHLKMQADHPYMVSVNKPDSIIARHAFILENTDTRPLGLITDINHNLYVLEHKGYKLIPLQAGKVNPETDRIVITKNLFNWVIKISSPDSTRWVALDSDTYTPLGQYTLCQTPSKPEILQSYIFPFELSFTSPSDCFVYPRITFFPWHFIYLNLALAVIVTFLPRHRGKNHVTRFITAGITLFLGIYTFIPFCLIKYNY